MSDEIWTRNEIESPCIRVCVIHPAAQICVGCYRSLAEIGSWSAMSSDERRKIMAELPARASTLVKRRGGRAARLSPDSATEG
ncbi:DUF1289 domain-containing protein [Xinfangfangia sp. D13-10-4-6]|uniref:DUF1289 domain-containing protein n=1 Tax=Pseudogemmobacter hezensis TaxID=2737662 RepID=UPI00155317E5|nr:DUF1289 domain-containing protein [Pseudogemmobacter hezensis]